MGRFWARYASRARSWRVSSHGTVLGGGVATRDMRAEGALMSRGEVNEDITRQAERWPGEQRTASRAEQRFDLQPSAAQPSSREGRRARARKLPASIIYCVLGAAFATLMLGATPRPKESLASDSIDSGMRKAATQLASLSAKPNEDPTGGFHFFIMLDPQTTEWHHESWADHLESRLKAKLARHGFPNIGVSVSRDGAVFLAGTLFDRSEKSVVERIVERTPGVVSVHFPHPEIQKLYGPPYLGIETAPSGPHAGVKVMKVWPGSPAAMAGIQPGDVIVRFDGSAVRGPETFRYLVASHVGGQRIPLTIERGHAQKSMIVRLGPTAAVVLD